MKVRFQYDKNKDIWCLLNKGKGSNNSGFPTKVYEELVLSYGENPSPENTSAFIDQYIIDKNISISNYIARYQSEWDIIANEYQKRAEKIFGVSLPKDILGYLTVNNRCPYRIDENYFYVTMPASSIRGIVMHELWHFYTWYAFGADQVEKLGTEKYNDMKEALTVLLNIECADLFPEGAQDKGYPQHKELREKVIRLWSEDKNIQKIWNLIS